MITEDMIAFWLRHRKYPDILDRGSPSERSVLTGEEWTLLEDLVASLKLSAQNLVSQEFQERTERQLAMNVARPAIEKLRTIARDESAGREAAV